MQFLHSSVTSSLLGPNILLNTMFSNTLSLLSSRNVSDKVSHPYKTMGLLYLFFMEISVELGNEHSVSIKCVKFLGQLRNHQLLNKDYVARG